MTRFKQEDSDTCPLSMIYTTALIKQGLKQVNTQNIPSYRGESRISGKRAICI